MSATLDLLTGQAYAGRSMRWVALLLGAALAATYVSPAIGGPDLAGRIKRVDTREKRHYADLDRRIRAAGLLALNRTITTSETSAPMTQSSDGRFFSASVVCGSGTHATGGGVDWSGQTLYADWHVIESAPWPNGWKATVHIGSAFVPNAPPKVYAICTKG